MIDEGVERCQARCQGFGRRQIQVSSKCRGTKTSDTRDEAQLIHQVSRSYQGDRNFLDRSTRCRGGVKIVIRKRLEARQIARCWGGVKLTFKISFSRRKKHRHECNQACNSTNDPKHHINLSKWSLNNNFKYMDPKTHIHILNKSNQFYFSKISQDSLVSIH